MLMIPGGCERTKEDYRRLFESAGFQTLGRIVSTRSEMSVIEGQKV